MSLVKWIRKNERKLMSWVVILIMVAFVGGSALQQILSRMGGGKQVVAYYGENEKITALDMQGAQEDLKVLAQLGGREFLSSLPSVTPRQPNFKGLLISQLIFPDSQSASMVSGLIKRSATQGQHNIDPADVDSFFEELKNRSTVYWLMLTAEAREAGIVITNDEAKKVLKQLIPAISQRQYDAAQAVSALMRSLNMSEDRIIGAFADLMSVITYTDMILSSEDVTTSEIRAAAGRMQEKLSSEYVAFKATDFVKEQKEPTDNQIAKQFEKFKAMTKSVISDDNPMGFGYQIPARVQLEYIAVQLSDVKDSIDAPTAGEMETYYQNNLSSFMEKAKTDPKSAEEISPARQKLFTEVADHIRYTLTNNKSNTQADMMMNKAIVLTEAAISGEDIEKLDSEQFKAKAVDFAETAKTMEEEFGVKVYTGKTGYLSPEDIALDNHLGRLAIEGSNQRRLNLGKAVFAIDELGVTKLSRFDGRAPKMYENIGPMKDQFGNFVVLARVVDAKKEETPANANASYSTDGLAFGKDVEEKTFSVKDAVIEDVKLAAAFETAQSKAEALIKVVEEKGWDEAIKAYNEALPKPENEGDAVVGQIQLDKLTNRSVGSDSQKATIAEIIAENPAMKGYMQKTFNEMMLVEELREIPEAGVTELLNVNKAVAFEPLQSSYAVKDITITTGTKQDYAKAKGQTALTLDMRSAEGLAVVHLNPAKLLERMNFRDKTAKEETDDSEE